MRRWETLPANLYANPLHDCRGSETLCAFDEIAGKRNAV